MLLLFFIKVSNKNMISAALIAVLQFTGLTLSS